MNQEKIGNFIKEIRIKNNLSQQKFADILGVTSQAVSKWENGKNIPDIAILNQISKLYSVNIEEILNGEYNQKENTNLNKKVIALICFFIIIIFLLIIFIFIKRDEYSFKILSTSCDNFNITGTIAYNDKKSSIYITNVQYCGGDDNTVYKKLECTLYEKNGNNILKIGNSIINENDILENFLKNIEFNIEHYSKMCNHFNDDNLYLEIIATSKDDKNISYKIPLKLTENCNAKKMG